MIVDAIASGLLGLVQTVLTTVLPTSSLSLPDASGFIPWYAWANGFLPLSEAIDLMVVSVQVLGVLAGVWAVTRLLKWAHVLG